MTATTNWNGVLYLNSLFGLGYARFRYATIFCARFRRPALPTSFIRLLYHDGNRDRVFVLGKTRRIVFEKDEGRGAGVIRDNDGGAEGDKFGRHPLTFRLRYPLSRSEEHTSELQSQSNLAF